MNVQRLEDLLGLLPAEAPYLVRVPHNTRGFPREVDWRAYALNDPGFGWGLITSFLSLGRELPAAVSETELVRPYSYLAYGREDAQARQAIGLEFERPDQRRILARCWLLVSGDYSAIGRRLRLSQEVVRIYESLFWNIRDRIDDRCFVNSLVYPQSRQVELIPGYHRNESPLYLALRATVSSGIEAAEELLGLRPVSGADGKAWAAQVLRTADLMLKMGFIHQNLAVYKQARRLLRSTKREDPPKNRVDSQYPALGISDAIAMSFYACVNPARHRSHA